MRIVSIRGAGPFGGNMTTNEVNQDFFDKGLVNQTLENSMTQKDYLSLKRFTDFILSSILILPIIVFVFFVGVLVKLESSGGMFYKQMRVGKDGKLFEVYKLRSMYCNADQIGPLYTNCNDERITRIGRIIRKFRIDELPQIINIFRGEMSFIGPRPLTEYEYLTSGPEFMLRTQVLPGVSGLAQVSGGNNLTNDEKLRFDLQYIDNASFQLDCRIFMKTLYVIITGHGAR